MPHAALWVVQHYLPVEPRCCPHGFNAARGFVGGAALTILKKDYETLSFNAARGFVGGAANLMTLLWLSIARFQCRTRLCGWCSVGKAEGRRRGCVVSMPHAAIPFRPHHRFAVPLPRSRRGGFSFTARQLLFPMRRMRAAAKYRRSEPIGALMPHAALWVVQRRYVLTGKLTADVSMPHAALWVVQLIRRDEYSSILCFNAARGFVGGAALNQSPQHLPLYCFNAARGFVGGAALETLAWDNPVILFQCRTRLCGWCSALCDMQNALASGFQCRTRLCGWCSHTIGYAGQWH